ncbi:MAG: hypothetical protein C5B53_10355 [Candidatus Melainabacteria bacterium]|nr:MAG: hypothetical protein C5B53_10355 [Candidatus Melainabacteria bacterium]
MKRQRANLSKLSVLIAVNVLLSGSFQDPAFALVSGVMVGGQQAFNPNSAQKSSAIQKNINNALVASPNKGPSAVGIVLVKGQPVITLGGFYICTVDQASAKAANTTPTLLAQRWASGLKAALQNQPKVTSYVNRLTDQIAAQPGTTTTEAGSYPYYKQGKAIYVPAGMTIPVTLRNGLSSENAQPGDLIEATITEDINLGETSIPQNSIVSGQITDAKAGSRLAHAGVLGLKFNKIRTPEGVETPIVAHIIGGLSKYGEVGGANTGVYAGEGTRQKVKRAALHGAIGAGAGALLGTTIGAIASHGYGTGRGAIAGTVIGGSLGVAESLLLHKGADVHVSSGEVLKLQLDAPATLACN